MRVKLITPIGMTCLTQKIEGNLNFFSQWIVAAGVQKRIIQQFEGPTDIILT